MLPLANLSSGSDNGTYYLVVEEDETKRWTGTKGQRLM